MGGRRGIPLKDRIRTDGGPHRDESREAAASAAGPDDVVLAGTRPAGRRHCWVRLPDHDHDVEGLVYQWTRDRDDGWLALVIYIDEQPTGTTAIQQWLSARRLRPAGE
jgi:hypothetical protein